MSPPPLGAVQLLALCRWLWRTARRLPARIRTWHRQRRMWQRYRRDRDQHEKGA